jgi:hypothetical protein
MKTDAKRGSLRRLVVPFWARSFLVVSLCATLISTGMPLRASSGAGSSTAAQDDPLVPVADAVRFLEQATFGPSFINDPTDTSYPASVYHLQQVGFEGWLTEQFNPSLIQFTNYPSPGRPGHLR